MLFILFGLDDFSLHEALEKIKREIGDKSLLESNTTILDGQQLTANKLSEICSTLPFLGSKRLVVIEGFLGRFETRPGKERQKKKKKDNQQSYFEEFSALIEKLPETTVLVLVDRDIRNNNPFLKQLLPKARVKSFPLLRNNRLRQWISKRVQQEGGTISPQANDLLSCFVGSNLWVMAGEISKLVSYASGRCIEEEDVRAVVSSSQQTSVFNMVDAVLESRTSQAQQIIQQLLKMGLAPPYLLFMLARQARLLINVKELVRKGKSEFEIQNKLGLTSEFAWRKTVEQASRYSFIRLKELYQRLLATDLSIKTGKYEPELALNILVAEMYQQHAN